MIKCDPLPQPDHGRVAVSGLMVDRTAAVIDRPVDSFEPVVGSSAIFSCHPGFKLEGPEILRCEKRGQIGVWTPSENTYCESKFYMVLYTFS